MVCSPQGCHPALWSPAAHAGPTGPLSSAGNSSHSWAGAFPPTKAVGNTRNNRKLPKPRASDPRPTAPPRAVPHRPPRNEPTHPQQHRGPSAQQLSRSPAFCDFALLGIPERGCGGACGAPGPARSARGCVSCLEPPGSSQTHPSLARAQLLEPARIPPGLLTRTAIIIIIMKPPSGLTIRRSPRSLRCPVSSWPGLCPPSSRTELLTPGRPSPSHLQTAERS